MTTIAATSSDILVGQVESRILKGSFVSFGPGARVLNIKHPSDYSAVQVSCNTVQRNAGDIAIQLFNLFREPVGFTCIHIITGPDACPAIAHVQPKDPKFAARIKGKFDGYVKHVHHAGITIKVVPVEIGYEASVDPPSITPVELHLLEDRLAMFRIEDRLTMLRMEERPVVPECAVCLTEPEDPYRTTCGHWYCRACLVTQCYSVSKEEIPIRCLGSSGNCSRVFLLSELKVGLRPKAFEKLLDESFTVYIKTIKTIQECPTSHCQQTYRTSTDGSVITCSQCSTPICTTCQAPSHSGMTCAMYQRLGNAGYQTWSFNKYIRKCPRCKNLIEKTGGCERVDCICGARLCWTCMELWDENGKCRCRRIASGAQSD